MFSYHIAPKHKTLQKLSIFLKLGLVLPQITSLFASLYVCIFKFYSLFLSLVV